MNLRSVDYFYELKYKNGENEISYKFSADVDNYKLQEHLEQFLKSCSWDDEVLENIFIKDDLNDI